MEDPYAFSLTNPSLQRVLRFRPAAWFIVNWMLRSLKPLILGLLIRARYAEQAVGAAFQERIRQYVIVGAGSDSFALRRTDLVPPLRVFELERHVAKRGEPIKSEYSLRAMSELLTTNGLHTIEAVTMMDLAERYKE